MEIVTRVLVLCVLGSTQGFLQSKQILLEGNGYTGVTVAISSQLSPSEIQIQKIKDLFTAASAQLYKSTKNHLFFKDITIVIPKAWPDNMADALVSGAQVDTAHVIVDKPNPLVDNKPYVSGMTGCGQPGKHIHLEPFTVQILAGLADKILLHHWGHFRWGLFDEHGDKESPVQTSNTNPWFYSSQGTFKPNICTKDIEGVNQKGYCQSGQQCALDDDGLPEKDCKFCVNERSNTAKGSLMGKPEISSVVDFCDHADSAVPHNSEAETPQNKVCRGKSSWEIMRLHPDFKDTTPGSATQNTVPTFRVVQQRIGQNVVLVLDKSGSMNYYDESLTTNPLRQTRIEKLKTISSNYIRNWSPNATSIAVVTFNGTASVAAPLTPVTSDTDRQNLVTLVDNIKAAGATSIGAGIQKAIEILKNASSDNIRGNEIILVSDGANTVSPGPDDVRETVLREGVIIQSVAIGKEADQKIDKLAKDSGGFSFFYSGNEQSTTLADIFLGIAASSSDDEDKIYQIESKSLNITKGRNYSSVLTIDATIGRDTTIVVLGSGRDFASATLSGPTNGLRITEQCSDSCRLKIDGLAEIGDYVIEISTTRDTDIILTLTAQSYPRNPSAEVFTATAWTLTELFDFSPSTPVVLYSSVQKGVSPVLDADVTMVVEDSEGHFINVDLQDDGQGMDITKGDGQYAGVILPTQLKSNGRHSLKLLVTGKDGEAKILVPETGRRKRDTTSGGAPSTLVTQNVGGFKRVTSGGTFTVQNYSVVTGDALAPARITTLRLQNSEGGRFNVSWNAVGDDINVGKATAYKVLLSNNFQALLNTPETVSPLTGNIPTPAGPGELEVFSLRVTETGVSYFLAVQAVDEAGNVGEVSNIVPLSVLSDHVTWKRAEQKEVTSSQAFSYVGLIVSACAAILFIFVFILCGICLCKRNREYQEKSEKFSDFPKKLPERMISTKRDMRIDYRMANPYMYPPNYWGYYGQDRRFHGYNSDSYLYYIS